MLFMETMAVNCENHTKQASTLHHKTQSFRKLGQAVYIATTGKPQTFVPNTKLPDQRHQITGIHEPLKNV